MATTTETGHLFSLAATGSNCLRKMGSYCYFKIVEAVKADSGCCCNFIIMATRERSNLAVANSTGLRKSAAIKMAVDFVRN